MAREEARDRREAGAGRGAKQEEKRTRASRGWPMLGRLLMALAVVLAAPALAAAQRTVHTNTNAWFTLNADVALNQRWGLLFDTSVRRSGPVDEWQAFFVRAGVAYAISEHVRVAIGGNFSESWPYGEVPSAYAYPEWRMWEQVVISHAAGTVAFSHRYRLEQREQGRRSAGAGGEVDHYMRTSRFRYQVRGTLPLRGETIDPGEAYLTVANELFINFGANVQNNVFDQDRASAAVGWRLNKLLRAEIGFMEQLSLKPNGRDVERNHTFTAALNVTRVAPAKRS